MFIVIGVVLTLIVSIVTSLCFHDGEKQKRTVVHFLLIICVTIVTCGYLDQRGLFGDPHSLDKNARYHVLSVTPIDKKSTIVILCDEYGKTVPIEFFTKINADTNGFYTLVGDNRKNYNLAPIK